MRVGSDLNKQPLKRRFKEFTQPPSDQIETKPQSQTNGTSGDLDRDRDVGGAERGSPRMIFRARSANYGKERFEIEADDLSEKHERKI